MLRDVRLLLLTRRPRLQNRIRLQRQLNTLTALRRLVDAQNNLDAPPPFVAINRRLAVLLHRINKVAELDRMAMMADRGWITRSTARALMLLHLIEDRLILFLRFG